MAEQTRTEGHGLTVADLLREEVEWLRGPIHGRIQTARGWCSDEVPHVEIDAYLATLDDIVCSLADRMDEQGGERVTLWRFVHGPGNTSFWHEGHRPSPRDLEDWPNTDFESATFQRLPDEGNPDA